jgi:hypothetical protein
VTTVILANDLQRLKPLLKDGARPLRYLNLVDTRESVRILQHLRGMPQARELSRADLFRELGGEFRREYIEFMGRMNSENRSLTWWALPFTNKNPLATGLCRSAFQFLLVSRLARSGPETLLVVTDNHDVASQMRAWGRVEGVQTIDSLRKRRTLRGTFKALLPAGPLLAFVKILWTWLRVRRHALPSEDTGPLVVVASLLHPQSFPGAGKYRDVYFGRLVEELAGGRERAMVFGLLQGPWRSQLSRLNSLGPGVPVTSVEAYLSLGDVMRCGVAALAAYLRPPRLRTTAELDGVDVRRLVTRAVRQAVASGNVCMNMRVYLASRRLARRLPISRCLYPYENRSWEKMLTLGFRSGSPATRLVGYQHASVTLSHTNFILGNGESKVLPLPDVIATTGPVVTRWLEKEGNYPPGMFRTTCALRQSKGDDHPFPRRRPERLSKLLVVLATSIAEYVNTLVFLERALAGAQGYQLRIRPHPTISLDSALELAPIASNDFFAPSTGTLDEALQWADVVLYASSTVGMEAVALGIPAIHLDLGDFLDTDPMFGWSELKWAVRDPARLIDAIRSIEAIPSDRFAELQREGQAYVRDYLSPVTESGLRVFSEA